MPAFLQDDRLNLTGLGFGGSSPRSRGETLGSRDTFSPRINPIRRLRPGARTILEEEDDDSDERTISEARVGAVGTASSARTQQDDELEHEEGDPPEQISAPGRLRSWFLYLAGIVNEFGERDA